MNIQRQFFQMMRCATVVVLFWGALGSRAGVSPIYVNNGIIAPPDIPPQVDARIFVNYGTFVYANASFFLNFPYQAQNVRYWTNYGSMSATPGFDFFELPGRLRPFQMRIPRLSLPRDSILFQNDGEIEVSTWLSVRAQTLLHHGAIHAGETARVALRSSKGRIDLTRGSIRLGGIASECVENTFSTDVELRQNYAVPAFIRSTNLLIGFDGVLVSNGVNTVTATNGTPLSLPLLNFNLQLPFPFIPSFQVLRPGRVSTNFVTNVISGLRNCGDYAAFVNIQTNFLGRRIDVVFAPTNFAGVTNLAVDVKFNGNGFFSSGSIIQFLNPFFDVIEQRIVTNILTFEDRFGSLSLFRGRDCTLLDNPANLLSVGNAELTPDLFFNANFVTNQARYIYDALSVDIGNTNSPFFAVSSVNPFLFTPVLGTVPRVSDPTNVLGNVDINAPTLDMTQARIRAENGISIQTRNLTGNNLSSLDAAFISLDLHSRSPDLILSNAVPPRVNRLVGSLDAWAGSWSVPVANITVFGTNIETWDYHVLVLGACFTPTHPTIVHRMTLEATNIVIEDTLAVNSRFVAKGRSLTFGSNSSLTMPSRSTLALTNLIGILDLTNYGVINVSDGAYFGVLPAGYSSRTRVRAYNSFVNHNTLDAGSIAIRAPYVESSGPFLFPSLMFATNGPIRIDAGAAGTVVLSNGSVLARSDLQITTGDLLVSDTILNAGTTNGRPGFYIPGAIVLDAENSLGDGGPGTLSDWFVTAGVRIPRAPAQVGDFMNTRIVSRASTFVQSRQVWAGTDHGPVPEGFSNNLALGQLTLDGAMGTSFHFSGAFPGAAMYVDYLELLNFPTNFNLALGVDPNFTIYIANANVPPDKLDMISNGRVRWVSSFTGPLSSTNLVYPDGSVHTFNIGLVSSQDIDSDGDGINNANDCTPIQVLQDGGIDTTLPENNCGVPAGRPAAAAPKVKGPESSDAGTGNRLTNFISGPVNARVTVKDAVADPLLICRVQVDAGKQQ